jgi:molybdate transport system ATP-binding protein
MFTQRLQAKVGDKVRLRVRAGDVSIALAGEHKSSILNIFRATVARLSEVTPGEVLVQLACPDDPTQAVLARVTRKSLDELGLRPGLDVYARVKGVSVR